MMTEIRPGVARSRRGRGVSEEGAEGAFNVMEMCHIVTGVDGAWAYAFVKTAPELPAT